MKLDGFPDLFFVVSVIVPGFIYCSVRAKFIVNRDSRRELTLLRFLTVSAYNYAICSPLIYALLTSEWPQHYPILAAFSWAVVIFISPVLLALISVCMSAAGWLRRFAGALGFQLIHAVPTAWDWQFSRSAYSQYVRVTLADGSQVLGLFGNESLASSEWDQRDLYLEKAYRAGEGAAPWIEVQNSGGIYIAHGQIRHIEFWPV